MIEENNNSNNREQLQNQNSYDEDEDNDDQNFQQEHIIYKRTEIFQKIGGNNENIIIVHKKYEDIEKYIENMIEDTMDQTGIPFGRALLLLSRNSYDINKIQVTSDEKLLDLIYPKPSKEIESMENMNTCLLCFDELNDENKYSLPCKHYFCKDCFSRYVQEVFKDGQFCIYKTCPLDGCLEKLGKDEFKTFLDDDKFKVYKKFLVKDAFGNSEKIISCPQPECPYVQMTLRDDMIKLVQRNLQCLCKHEYCNQCKEIGHFPCNCNDFRKWMSKLEGQESGHINDEWLIMNTKSCPKCQVRIEKNQGCMHMTCKQCQHHFCWICTGDWKGHNDYYKCSKLDQTQIDELEKEKNELSHFKFHSGRYQNHFSNIRNVQKEIDGIRDSIQAVQQKLIKNQQKQIDLEIIEKYCQQILRGRKYLPFFYAKGFFITDKKKLEFFNSLIEDYVRIIEGFNSNLDNLKDIVDKEENNKITLKESFYKFMNSLSAKLGTCQRYINSMLKQFSDQLDNYEKISEQKLKLYPIHSEAIFKKKQEKHDQKQKEKEMQRQLELQLDVVENNTILEESKDNTTIQQSQEQDSSNLKKRKVQFSDNGVQEETIKKQIKPNEQNQSNEEIPVNNNNKIIDSQESNVFKSQSVLIYRSMSENAPLICIDCGENQATNEYGVCDSCFDSLNS